MAVALLRQAGMSTGQAFSSPQPFLDYPRYLLEISGQFMADNRAGVVYVSDLTDGATTCGPVGTQRLPRQIRRACAWSSSVLSLYSLLTLTIRAY